MPSGGFWDICLYSAISRRKAEPAISILQDEQNI